MDKDFQIIKEYIIEDCYTEEECQHLLESLKAFSESDSPINLTSLQEFELHSPTTKGPTDIKNLGKLQTGTIAVVSAISIISIISALAKSIKSKYTLDAKKLYYQTKELNDLYTKVEDLITHDRLARFKHGNDMVDYEIRKLILKDSRNPEADYIFKLDEGLFYYPKYFIGLIENKLKEIESTDPKDRDAEYENAKNYILYQLEDIFEKGNYIAKYYVPMMKVSKIKNVKLEKCIQNYKGIFSSMYNYIAYINNETSSMLKNLYIVEDGYKKMIQKYGNDRKAKDIIDSTFKKIINQTTKCINFNDSVVAILNDIVKFYVSELEQIYDLIRQ